MSTYPTDIPDDPIEASLSLDPATSDLSDRGVTSTRLDEPAPVTVTEPLDESAHGEQVTGDPGDNGRAHGDDGRAHGDEAAFDASTHADGRADAAADGGAEPNSAPSVEQPRPSRTRLLEREGEIAADFLETLLDICDLDGDLDVDIDGDRAAVSLVDSDEGRVPRRLVGQNGAVLEALQELTRLAVQSETGDRSRLMLDVAGHRAERKAVLVELARTAISKVKGGSAREPLEPMSAFERKVVHDVVLAAGLVSESEGVEPRRFVVVLPG